MMQQCKPSEAREQGMLRDGDNIPGRVGPCQGDAWLQPFVFFDIDGREQRSDGKSVSNRCETV